MQNLLVAAAAAASIHYGAFGNYRTGDCGIVAVANAIQEQHPKAKITTGEVVRYYRTVKDPDGDGVVEPWALSNLETRPLAGYLVSSFSSIDRSQLAGALRRGEVIAQLHYQEGDHDVLVTGADRGGVSFVSDGVESAMPWAFFLPALADLWSVSITKAA